MEGDSEEVDADVGDEGLLERVGAIDVAKASAKVCVRIPGAKRRITRIWDVTATTNAIMALADELAELRIERVVLEATSDYWRPYFYLLEARELCVWLVNARDVKNVPGRPKTDKLDSIWLAKLNERGMLRPSFVPPKEIRELRDYTRLRAELVEERSRYKNRLEKLLEDTLIKLSVVATDIFGKSPGDARGPHRRRARSRGPRRARPGQTTQEDRGATRGTDWLVRRPSRRACPDSARPDRRSQREVRPDHGPRERARRTAART